MIKSVNNYPVSQLLDTETSVVFTIPRYQREYSWSKGQWESLFDDLIENDPGYFLGSLICVNQSDDSLSVQDLELIDGQQRHNDALASLRRRIQHAESAGRQPR